MIQLHSDGKGIISPYHTPEGINGPGSSFLLKNTRDRTIVELYYRWFWIHDITQESIRNTVHGFLPELLVFFIRFPPGFMLIFRVQDVTSGVIFPAIRFDP